MTRMDRTALAGLALLLGAFAIPIAAQSTKNWPMGGHDKENTRFQSKARDLNASTAGELGLKWVQTVKGDVVATPAVKGKSVYVTSWDGYLYKLNARTGKIVWERPISDYTGISRDFSRSTPAIAGRLLILGNQSGRLLPAPDEPSSAKVFAVDRRTGNLVWVHTADTHPSATIVQSPVVFRNRVYVGVASFEERDAGLVENYPCCTFRGSMLALKRRTGVKIWQTHTVPQRPTDRDPLDWYSGSAIWGSTPVVSPKRNIVYVGTGNNYSSPADVVACVQTARAENLGDDAIRACSDPDNYFDSVLAFNMDSGVIEHAHRTVPFDTWNVTCAFGSPACPDVDSPDYDFGQGPTLVRLGREVTRNDDDDDDDNGSDGADGSIEVLGAGQKSGDYWLLDPDTLSVVQRINAGPGGIIGGMQWGSAQDGERIYVAITNSGGESVELDDGTEITGSFWSALDATTGEILWRTPVPGGTFRAFGSVVTLCQNGSTTGQMTVANDVVFATSLATGANEDGPAGDDCPAGHSEIFDRNMFALDANSGEILWSFNSGGSVNGGPAVVGNTAYWGSGYRSIGNGSANNKLFAFSVPEFDDDDADRD